jgi:diphthine synthase
MTIFFIGLGINGCKYLTLKGLEALRFSNKIFLDSYTSKISEEDIKELSKLISKEIIIANREMLENEALKIIEEAKDKNIAILIPGDPFIATTHISIKELALERNIKIEIIHGVSIVSAAISLSGLSTYRFGRIVTIPKTNNIEHFRQPYQEILENSLRGLHTLSLLDTKNCGLSINDALKNLMEFEEIYGENFLKKDMLIMAFERIGYEDSRIIVKKIEEHINEKYEKFPQCMIFLGEIQFNEKEILKKIFNISNEYIEKHQYEDIRKKRSRIYIQKLENVFKQIEYKKDKIINEKILKIIEYAYNYYEDSKYFYDKGDYQNSLISSSYSEGLLDSLRMLNLIEFKWESIF